MGFMEIIFGDIERLRIKSVVWKDFRIIFGDSPLYIELYIGLYIGLYIILYLE
jgi:hypothetical protein